MHASLFATVFIALFCGHHIGDFWAQTHHQAITKGKPGPEGRQACTHHVMSLTATKAAIMLAVCATTGVRPTILGLLIGFTVDASSHWWADRRFTLSRLAHSIGKGDFYNLGGPDSPDRPVTATGAWAPTTGTGAIALDQSWHIAWLLVTAIIITTV